MGLNNHNQANEEKSAPRKNRMRWVLPLVCLLLLSVTVAVAQAEILEPALDLEVPPSVVADVLPSWISVGPRAPSLLSLTVTLHGQNVMRVCFVLLLFVLRLFCFGLRD